MPTRPRADKKDKNVKAEEEAEEDAEPAPSVSVGEELLEDAAPDIAATGEATAAEPAAIVDPYSVFGEWFQANSTIMQTPEGLLLNWSMQYSSLIK